MLDIPKDNQDPITERVLPGFIEAGGAVLPESPFCSAQSSPCETDNEPRLHFTAGTVVIMQ